MKRRYTAQPSDDENGRTWDVFDGDVSVAGCIPTRTLARKEADEYEAAWRVVLAFEELTARRLVLAFDALKKGG